MFLGIGTKLIHFPALHFYSRSSEIMASAPQEQEVQEPLFRALHFERRDTGQIGVQIWPPVLPNCPTSVSGLNVLTCNLTEASHHQSTQGHLGPMGDAEGKGKTGPKGRPSCSDSIGLLAPWKAPSVHDTQ